MIQSGCSRVKRKENNCIQNGIPDIEKQVSRIVNDQFIFIIIRNSGCRGNKRKNLFKL